MIKLLSSVVEISRPRMNIASHTYTFGDVLFVILEFPLEFSISFFSTCLYLKRRYKVGSGFGDVENLEWKKEEEREEEEENKKKHNKNVPPVSLTLVVGEPIQSQQEGHRWSSARAPESVRERIEAAAEWVASFQKLVSCFCLVYSFLFFFFKIPLSLFLYIYIYI